MPIYPAAMPALPPSMTVPVRWQPLRVTAAVLAFVALVLVVASSFLSLYEGELTIDVFDSTETLEVTFTPWEVEYSEEELGNVAGNEIPRTGYPIVFAAVALAFAAAACWYAATPAAGRTAHRVAGVVTAVSSAFLIGTFWTVAILVSTGVNNIIMLGTANSGLETDASYLAGYWLLLIATVAGFAAAILSLIPIRQPAWQPPRPPLLVNPFVSTPPYGVALPMTAQAPLVDPLTGHPVAPGQASPPAGVPLVQPYAQGPAVDPLAGPAVPVVHPSNGAVDPLTGQPLATVDPLTGLPLTAGRTSPPDGTPFTPGVAAGPVAGQPSPAGGIPFVPGPVVDPLTGQPAVDGLPSPAAAVDPVTGQPLDQAPVPFTPEPVGPVNGIPAQATEPPPIEIPEAPPPAPPPGPAVPATEDPLAEPAPYVDRRPEA